MGSLKMVFILLPCHITYCYSNLLQTFLSLLQ